MSPHVEHGYILKMKDGIEMTDTNQELAESLEFVEKYVLGSDGKPVKVKVY